MIGLHIRNGSLYFNDTLISNNIGEVGLIARPNRDLYFNNEKIATGNINNPVGLYHSQSKVFFDGIEVGSGGGSEPVGEFSAEGYWIPPTQPENLAGKMWSYATILSKYDALAAIEPRLTKHRYNDGSGNAILSSAGNYELYHYLYEPPMYDKTLFLQAQIHGNEKDSRLTLYRMIQIMLTLRNTAGYTAWQQIYDRCRLIIIPVVNPYGNDNDSMNIPYKSTQYGINANRNMDFNQQYGLASTGVGGDVPFDINETRHIRDVVAKYGAHTIDYAIDYHDGSGINMHYWINYGVDAPNRPLVNNFVQYLVGKYVPVGVEPVIYECKDNPATGIVMGYFSKTLGVTSSTNEWIGGLFGYSFDSAHMTHSLDIRSNMLFIALNNDVKGWNIRESENAEYFHFDYPKAFTRDSIRKEGAEAITLVTDAKIRTRWDTLQAKFPTLISKSSVLGVNATGDNVHTYTFGSGAKKVMYVGGVMRYGGTRKIDEFAIYQLIEYLCNSYVVNQSKFLKDLRDNYTIIVLPFIDNIAQNSEPYMGAGINNAALSRQRWVIGGDSKTVPATGVHGADNYGVQIIKNLIDSNTNLKCIVSGGEFTTGYGGNDQTEYATGFQSHFVVPKNMMFNAADYANHLTVNRDENVVVENTKGFTFGDYAYDQFGIPVYFVQLKVSNRWAELSADHTLTADQYLYANYEAGRRMANIVNIFLI